MIVRTYLRDGDRCGVRCGDRCGDVAGSRDTND